MRANLNGTQVRELWEHIIEACNVCHEHLVYTEDYSLSVSVIVAYYDICLCSINPAGAHTKTHIPNIHAVSV